MKLFNFPRNGVFLSLETVFILANSTVPDEIYLCIKNVKGYINNNGLSIWNPDEMPRSVAFHPGLHCLPKCSFTGFHFFKRKL